MKSLAQNHEGYGIPISPESVDEFYPSLYIESKDPLDLPESGEARIRFVRTKKSVETPKGRETRYCYSLDITAIGDIKEDRKRESDSYEEVDRLMKEVTSEEDED